LLEALEESTRHLDKRATEKLRALIAKARGQQ
jgi:hypothetical protein